MDRSSRSELLITVEAQQEKLQKYEKKLRDLIGAYKGLQKEKDALEASVNALSAVQSSRRSKRDGAEKHAAAKTKTNDEAQAEKHKVADPLNASGVSEEADSLDEGEDGEESSGAKSSEESETEDVKQLREQLNTLTSSLATVSQEKSKMEANYQAEKKQRIQELEDKQQQWTKETNSQEKHIKELSEEIQEWKTMLRNQQHEREKEHSDHGLMIRELQKVVADERMAKEQLEHQLDEVKEALVNEEQQVPDVADQYEKKIRKLSDELDAMRSQLEDSEQKASQPPPLLLKLQKEMAEDKAQYRICLQQEQSRAHDSQTQLKLMAQQSEERISSLEAKLSELSEVVGNYERLRCHDQQSIHKLRERISQLDLENTALARTARASPGLQDSPVDVEEAEEAMMDLQTIMDKMINLKGLLKLANEKEEKPVDIEELLQGGIGSLDSDLHKKCVDDYGRLKEEFERYKLRAQSVLKSKSHSKEPGPTKELESLRSQVSELKDRLRFLRRDYEELELKLKDTEAQHSKTIQALNGSHKHQLANREADYKQRMAELEVEIRRHRDRTIALLSEKDCELEKLKAQSPERMESHYMSSYRELSPSPNREIGASCEEETAVSELLSRTTFLSGSPGETTLLHFAQEQARKDVEIQTLRRQKHSVESALRDLQHSSILKEQKQAEQIESLEEEVRKHERNQSRECANLEYLKNVVYHHIASQDSLTKHQTLKAISTILQFSPHERDAAWSALDTGWFGYGAQTSPKAK